MKLARITSLVLHVLLAVLIFGVGTQRVLIRISPNAPLCEHCGKRALADTNKDLITPSLLSFIEVREKSSLLLAKFSPPPIVKYDVKLIRVADTTGPPAVTI